MPENANYEFDRSDTIPPEAVRRVTAAARGLYRIGEVSRLTDTKAFVLRYWETEFPMLQPVKSPKGHRLYRQEDVATVLQIKRLLYDEGFTIAGARRHLREGAGGEALGDESAVRDAVRTTVPLISTNVSSEISARSDYADGAERDTLTPENREGIGELFPAERAAEPMQILSGGRLALDGAVSVDRKVLLDLRDELRSLLTLLESE